MKEIFENWIEKINSFSLDKKEKIRWISLKIEDSDSFRNSSNKEEELEKIIFWLNREIFKAKEEELKAKANTWDNQALLEYTQLISKAKKVKIK